MVVRTLMTHAVRRSYEGAPAVGPVAPTSLCRDPYVEHSRPSRGGDWAAGASTTCTGTTAPLVTSAPRPGRTSARGSVASFRLMPATWAAGPSPGQSTSLSPRSRSTASAPR